MTKLKCWNCGHDDLMITPTMLQPIIHNGNRLIFTVCTKCWKQNEFVNEKPYRIVFIPMKAIKEGLV